MAETQSNTNSNSSSNSSNSSTAVTVDIVDVIDDGDEDCSEASEGCCDQPKVLCLKTGSVIIVRINRGELSSSKYQSLATQTAAKFKAVFPNNNILVIPNSTNYTVVNQPEVHA